jgi:hypothetical protein
MVCITGNIPKLLKLRPPDPVCLGIIIICDSIFFKLTLTDRDPKNVAGR